MEIITGKVNTSAMEILDKMEVLDHLETKVKDWIDSHVSKRRLWFSSDFLPTDEKINEDQERVIHNLRERVRGIKDSARVAVAVNLLTEEGLPHFHRKCFAV